MADGRPQVCRVGNYHMTGTLLGRGHFAKVEEATHRLLGKTVAIKILDVSCIQEEYARRHVKREARVLARLRHPCIAMLYETMTCGPRLYLVLEACGGGDLCTLVQRQRGLAESRARRFAAHLVCALAHMHARGVVHRDLKMENVMLDCTKQFVKIVDFGLSNLCELGGVLKTPCGSLEYAAPELFRENRRYGAEVDMWSVGVIVYGMVTGGLPFVVPSGSASGDRPQFTQIIAKGIGRRHAVALAHVSNECREFIKRLLQPDARLRLSAERAAAEPWLRRAPAPPAHHLDTHADRQIYREISQLTGLSLMEIATAHRNEPYGPIGGIYNIKSHQLMIQAIRRELRPESAQSEMPKSSHYKMSDTPSRPNCASSSLRIPTKKYSESSNLNFFPDTPLTYHKKPAEIALRPYATPQVADDKYSATPSKANPFSQYSKKQYTSYGQSRLTPSPQINPKEVSNRQSTNRITESHKCAVKSPPNRNLFNLSSESHHEDLRRNTMRKVAPALTKEQMISKGEKLRNYRHNAGDHVPLGVNALKAEVIYGKHTSESIRIAANCKPTSLDTNKMPMVYHPRLSRSESLTPALVPQRQKIACNAHRVKR